MTQDQRDKRLRERSKMCRELMMHLYTLETGKSIENNYQVVFFDKWLLAKYQEVFGKVTKSD